VFGVQGAGKAQPAEGVYQVTGELGGDDGHERPPGMRKAPPMVGLEPDLGCGEYTARAQVSHKITRLSFRGTCFLTRIDRVPVATR
jgi:hypothetical protein